MKVLLFIFISLTLCAPMIPYVFVVSNFSVMDILLPLFTIAMLKTKNSIPVPSILLAMLSILSLISLVVNSLKFNLDQNELFFVMRWLYYSVLVFFVYNVVVKEPETAIVIIWGMAYSVLISVVIVWYFWMQTPRYSGSIPMLHLIHEGVQIIVNRNYIGFFLSIGLPLWFVFALNNHKKDFFGLYLWLVVVFLSVSSILTFSKGTWLASFLPIVFILVVKLLRRSRHNSSSGILFSVLVMVFLMSVLIIYTGGEKGAFLNEVDNRIAHSGDANTQRLQFIIDSSLIMVFNPILGVGPGNYKDETVMNGFMATSDPHNALLWFGAELGILGLLLGLYTITHLGYIVFKMYYRETYQPNISFELLIVAYLSLMLNIFIHGLPFSMKHLWVLYAVAFALYRSRLFQVVSGVRKFRIT